MNEIKTALNTNAGLHDTLQTNFTALEARSGSVPLTYTFLTATTASDPGAGKLKLNNAAAISATVIYVSASDFNLNVYTVLSTFTSGDLLYIQNRTDSESGYLFQLGVVTDNTTWFSIAATFVSGGKRNIGNNDLCCLAKY